MIGLSASTATWLLAALFGWQSPTAPEKMVVNLVAPVAASTPNMVAASAPETPPQLPAKNLLQDVDLLQNAKTDLQNLPEFQGKKLRVYTKIDFFNGTRPRIELQLENPNMPNTLVFYTFEHGKWKQGEADDVSHIKNLSRQFTPLDDIDFTQVAYVADVWQQKAKQVQAVEQTPYHVMFVWLPAKNKRFWHTPTLEAKGKQFYLSINLDGSIWEFKGLSGEQIEEN